MLSATLTPEQTASYLRTLPAIRERCSRVHALAQEGKLQYFEYHPEQEDVAAAFCINIMKVLPILPNLFHIASFAHVRHFLERFRK